MPVRQRHPLRPLTAGANASRTEGALLSEVEPHASRRDEFVLAAAIGGDVVVGAAAAGLVGVLTHKAAWACAAGAGAFLVSLAAEVSVAAVWAYNAASS